MIGQLIGIDLHVSRSRSLDWITIQITGPPLRRTFADGTGAVVFRVLKENAVPLDIVSIDGISDISVGGFQMSSYSAASGSGLDSYPVTCRKCVIYAIVK